MRISNRLLKTPWHGRGQGDSVAPFRLPGLPWETVGLVGCVVAGLSLMTYTGYRTLFYSPEVHLTNKTRQDELLENDPEGVAEKGFLFARNGAFSGLGKVYGAGHIPSLFPEEKICPPEDTDIPIQGGQRQAAG